VSDGGRIAYLAAYAKALEAAVASGVDVRGYFAWSILDDLEWGAGFANRFGLVYVDYATQRRVPKASFDWCATVIRAQQHGDHA
jgi:beta-glucosidase